MIEVENWMLAQKVIGRWHPSDIAFITKMHYVGDEEREVGELVLTGYANRRDKANHGWPDSRNLFYRVSIAFEGVKSFSIKSFRGARLQIEGFDIADVSSRQWEGINYVVKDYENGAIEIMCGNIKILDVSVMEDQG